MMDSDHVRRDGGTGNAHDAPDGEEEDAEGTHGVCLGGLGVAPDEGAPEGQHLSMGAHADEMGATHIAGD